MSKVLIVIEGNRQETVDLPTMTRMVSALKQAIPTEVSVQTIAANELKQMDVEKALLCPLTLNLPDVLFRDRSLYQACQDIFGLRQHVAQQFNVSVTDGCFWLPIILTAKGPLYGEVIALSEEKQLQSSCNLSYFQPCHFSDSIRQQIYRLGYSLVRLLSAPPATYLMQFAVQNSEVCFDRLWPFPATAAIASLGVQEPDLFACHWCCLTDQAIFDLHLIPKYGLSQRL